MKIWSVHTGTHCACLQQCIFHYPWKARPPQSEPPSRSCTSFKHLVVNRAVFFFHSAGFCTDTEYAQHIKAQFCSRHATKTNALARREASSRKTTKKKKLRKKPKNFNHWIVFKDQPSNEWQNKYQLTVRLHKVDTHLLTYCVPPKKTTNRNSCLPDAVKFWLAKGNDTALDTVRRRSSYLQRQSARWRKV